MRIEITPETDAEKKALAQPWVRTGCLRFGLSGIGERTEESITGEFGFLHGEAIGICGDVARLKANLDMQAMNKTSVNGVLQVHQMIADAQQSERVAHELLANRNGMKIHRD